MMNVQMRWLERRIRGAEVADNVFFEFHVERLLQYRERIQPDTRGLDLSQPQWTEWQDVPVVEE